MTKSLHYADALRLRGCILRTQSDKEDALCGYNMTKRVHYTDALFLRGYIIRMPSE